MIQEYIVEPIREISFEHGHEIPAVRVTCKVCGNWETAEGSGDCATSRALAELRKSCVHPAKVIAVRPPLSPGEQPAPPNVPVEVAEHPRDDRPRPHRGVRRRRGPSP
jgi:hypothetical protein